MVQYNSKLPEIFRDFAVKKFDEPMSAMCTFKTGGNAALVLEPSDAAEITAALALCKKHGISYCVLGGGSNVLISDKGFDGVVIRIGKRLSRVTVDGDLILAEAGARLIGLSKTAETEGLAGLEFCCGIPGTLGGGILMNAGAYGGDMGGVTESVTAVLNGRTVKFQKNSCDFSYRHSIFEELDCVIIEAVLKLQKGVQAEIRARREDNTRRRQSSTPAGQPSAGSAFKRPKNDFAARLIEEAGLKGHMIGGAMISDIHSGFIVNTGTATSADIYALMNFAAETVYNKSGVKLVPEIKFIGEF